MLKKTLTAAPLPVNGIFSIPEPPALCPPLTPGFDWHPELFIAYNTL